MRTRTTGERNAIKAARVNHHVKVEVEDADRVYRDLTAYFGVNWVETVEWSESIDSPCATFSFSVRRDETATANLSTAPTWGGSPLNRNAAAAYAPLLDAGRQVKISTAVTAAGVAPTGGDWKHMLTGRIDEVQWHASPVVVTGRDLGGWLVDAYIADERQYATTTPTAIETVMQQVITDNGVYGTPTLYTPTSPGFALNNTKGTAQAKKSVLEALQQDYALTIGWVCRYRHDASDNYRLTFFDVNRSRTTADDSFGPSEYRDITALAISDSDVRNRIRGIYIDADGDAVVRTAENAVSQGKYGVRFMEIALAAGDLIDTNAEMDALLAAAVCDLGAPFAQHEMETLYYWPVQLGDLHAYASNADHYDSTQTLAVVAFSHKFANGEGVTSVQCRGNVVGAYRQWFRRTGNPTDPSTSERARSLSDFAWTDSADGLTRTYTWVRGGLVDAVWVYDALTAAPVLADPWPDAGDLPSTVLGAAVDSYTATIPTSGFQRFLQFEPRTADLAVGFVRRATLEPAPSKVALLIKAAVTDSIADLTLTITGSASTWPATWALYEDDPTGTPLAIATTTADATYTKLTSGFAVLGARPLPQRETRRWFLKCTDAAGLDTWAFASADRDAMPGGSVTVNDFRAAPAFVIAYDDDCDGVRISLPDGRAKTVIGLSGSGTYTYTVGTTVLDDTSTETLFAVDEVREVYRVELIGGDTWVTEYRGPLHGQPSNPPVVSPRVALNATRDAADVYGTVTSPVNEQMGLRVRLLETAGAPVYTLCVNGGSSVFRYVAPNTELGPSDWFENGGTRSQILAALPLVRDKISRVYLQAVGRSSAVQGPWVPVALSASEQPWLESVSLTWDEASGTLRLRARGGAFCQSARFEVDTSPTFSSPQLVQIALTDGQDVTQSGWTISGANRGRTWYGRVTPYNGPIVSLAVSGLAGVAQVDEVAVPATWRAEVSVAETTNTGTLTVVITDPGSVLHATDRVKAFVRVGTGTRTLTAPTTAPGGGATAGTYTFVITLDPLHASVIEPVVYLADGTTRTLGGEYFDADKRANIVNASVAYVGATATVTAVLDTDAATGASNFEYSTNGGGSWTPLTIPGSRIVTFGVAMSTSAAITVDLRAKNSTGAYGPTVQVQVSRYESIAQLTVVATPSSSTYSVSFTFTGSLVYYIDGSPQSLPSSPLTVSRNAAGGLPKSLLFVVTNGTDVVSEEVSVPPVDADTVTPDVQLVPASTSATTLSFNGFATNPKTGSFQNATYFFTDCSGTVNGSGVSAGGSATAFSNGIGVTANRPAIGSPPGTIRMRATVSGGGASEIIRTVSEQTKDFGLAAFEPVMSIGAVSCVGTWSTPAGGIVISAKTDSGAWVVQYDGVSNFNTSYTVTRNGIGGAAKTLYIKAAVTATGTEAIRSFTVPPKDPATYFFSSFVVTPNYTTDAFDITYAGTLPPGVPSFGDTSAYLFLQVLKDGVDPRSGFFVDYASPYSEPSGLNLVSSGGSGSNVWTFWYECYEGTTLVAQTARISLTVEYL